MKDFPEAVQILRAFLDWRASRVVKVCIGGGCSEITEGNGADTQLSGSGGVFGVFENTEKGKGIRQQVMDGS